jgi:hypothetical protein
LEPWAEEVEVPPGSSVEIYLRGAPGDPLEIEDCPEQVTVWAPSGATLDVVVDGRAVELACSLVAVPGTGNLSTKGFIGIAFGDSPEARPGGQPFERSNSSWRKWLTKIFAR